MMNSIYFILPELVLAAGAIALLMGGVFGLRRNVLGLVAAASVVFSFLAMSGTCSAGPGAFSGMLINDAPGFFMRSFVLLALALTVLMSAGYRWPDDDDAGEYYFFVLIAGIAMMFAVSAVNLIMIYLAVETLSIVSYVLACYFRKDLFSTEAGLKYFLFGALSTGLMLYGISLVYGLFGTLDLPGIVSGLSAAGSSGPLLVLAGVLVFAGFAFKASLVPFHMWVADVYEGAPWPVAAFFSIGPKALGFALLLRVFGTVPELAGLIACLAILTMTIGNLAAFHQNSVKRLLAFSSVAQAGYILAGFAAGLVGLKAAFFYIVIYAFMNMGAFACAALLSSGRAGLDDYKGVGRRSPLAAVCFALCLLSLAGLPPLAGFLAKFFVIWSAVETSHYVLAAAIVVNSVIAFFYYLKVIKAMFFDEALTDQPIIIPLAYQVLIAVCTWAVVAFGLWPQPVLAVLAFVFS